MEDAVLAPIQSAKSKDYEGGSGFNAAVKPSERTTNEARDEKPGDQSHGMEDPALTPVQAEEPKKCKQRRPAVISLCRLPTLGHCNLWFIAEDCAFGCRKQSRYHISQTNQLHACSRKLTA